MAKLSVPVLFLFFTLSLAGTPLTQPENDVTHLKLPSEKDVILPELPKTLPENDVILPELSNTLPGSDDSLPTDRLPSMSDHQETRSVHSVPLKLVRFRPINRRFRLRSNLPFRLCHHHLKPGSRRQIPFGNDMIPSSQRNIDFDKFVYHIGVRQIPSDRFNFHQYNEKNIWKFLDDREKFGEMNLKDQLPHHHHLHDDNEDHDHEHEQRKISKFLDDREKFWEMNLKDQSPHHHYHHDDDNEDNDHQQRKTWKFQIKHENRGNFGEIKSKNENQFRSHHIDDEADKRSKLYAKYYEMKLRKRENQYNAGEEDEKAKEVTKWHKKEKKKGGFVRSIRKFLHHYFD